MYWLIDWYKNTNILIKEYSNFIKFLPIYENIILSNTNFPKKDGFGATVNLVRAWSIGQYQ